MGADNQIVVNVGVDRSTFLREMFTIEDDGRINFGFTARSRDCVAPSDLFNRPVEFVDYLMEGGVSYVLQLREKTGRTEVVLTKLGTNRDRYLESHLQWHLSKLADKSETE